MPTGSEQVVGPRNAPRNSPELCIERRTLASHSSALTYWAIETDYIGVNSFTQGNTISLVNNNLMQSSTHVEQRKISDIFF